MTQLTTARQRLLKRIKFIKPALGRLCFLLFFLFPLVSFQNKIAITNGNLDFDSISLFFKKDISELNGSEIGRIYGKIDMAGDNVEAYLIYKDIVRIVGFDGSHPYEMLNGKRVSDKESGSIPPEIDIKSFVNPLRKFGKWENRIEGNIAVFYPEKMGIDSVKVFLNDALFDSFLVYDKNVLIMKSLYVKWNRGFPTLIETYDYQKSTVERVLNYKIKFHKKKY